MVLPARIAAGAEGRGGWSNLRPNMRQLKVKCSLQNRTYLPCNQTSYSGVLHQLLSPREV